MTTALHTWLTQAQESTRFDSVAAKYGLVVDTPSGMSQTGQNALRFLRSLTEHSPTFFEGQAKLLSPPTPDLPASPALSTSYRRHTPRSSPTGSDLDALFSFDMPPDEPVYLARNKRSSRPRPYPTRSTNFPPPPDPSPALDAQPYILPPPVLPKLEDDEADRERMSELMYRSMRVRAVAAASSSAERDTQW